MGQIKTFYSDSAKTQELYPRTCFSAITNDAGTETIGEAYNKMKTISFSNISQTITPTSNTAQSWDTNSEYLYHADVTINGVTSDMNILSCVVPTGTLENIAPYIENGSGYLRFYVKDSTSITISISSLVCGVYAGGTTQSIISTLFPVGSIYCTKTNTNPSTILGIGTWVLLTSEIAKKEIYGTGKAIGISDSNGAFGLGANSIGDLLVNTSVFGKDIGYTLTTVSHPTSTAVGLITKEELENISGATTDMTGLQADTIAVYMWERTE